MSTCHEEQGHTWTEMMEVHKPSHFLGKPRTFIQFLLRLLESSGIFSYLILYGRIYLKRGLSNV